MVGSRSVALVNVHASHEVSFGILRYLLDDMYALVVLALGVNDVDGLVAGNEHTLVADLTTHLAVERSVVENDLVESVLLLSYLAVAEDVTFVFRVVIADKLLLALAQFHPVAVLHDGSVAGISTSKPFSSTV